MTTSDLTSVLGDGNGINHAQDGAQACEGIDVRAFEELFDNCVGAIACDMFSSSRPPPSIVKTSIRW